MAASDSFRFPALKAVAQAYSVKKVFLEVSQNLQENTCARKTPGQVCNFIKIETLAQAFSCEFCKISKSTFSYRLPTVAPSAACSFIKIEIPTKMFFYEFGKISKNIFWQSTSRWLLLKFICEFWEHLFHRVPLRKCLFHAQVAVFQPADTVKNYRRLAFVLISPKNCACAYIWQAKQKNWKKNTWKVVNS